MLFRKQIQQYLTYTIKTQYPNSHFAVSFSNKNLVKKVNKLSWLNT